MVPYKILIIDDDASITEALRVMLEDLGYEIATDTRGIKIYDEIASFKPDLLILDVLLSGVDGRDICKRLQLQKSTKHIPIIMISAHPQVEQSARAAGADDFLGKPFSIETLSKKVRALLGSRS